MGVALALALLLDPSERVLVIAFTNHALDQFLHELLDAGVTSLSRIGGNSRVAALSSRNPFRAQEGSGKFPSFSRTNSVALNQCRRRADEIAASICADKVVLDAEPSVDEISAHLKVSQAKVFEALGFSSASGNNKHTLWDRWSTGAGPPLAGSSGNRSGGYRGGYSGASSDRHPIWNMSLPERTSLAKTWRSNILQARRCLLTSVFVLASLLVKSPQKLLFSRCKVISTESKYPKKNEPLSKGNGYCTSNTVKSGQANLDVKNLPYNKQFKVLPKCLLYRSLPVSR